MKVGLEIHIQVKSDRKLFCSCNPKDPDESVTEFRRRLRVSASELGEIDPAAAFEMKKGLDVIYLAGNRSSCLVEADEEPPHDPDERSIEAAIKVANLLRANVVDEIHFMRKIVIDGSNTTGFQRTALIALNGRFMFRERQVRIQTICLEEDAARLIEKGNGYVKYDLRRLGIPLIEIATEPLELSPKEARDFAESLGRTLKLTGLFERGLGTIRQDVNVSMEGGGIVEIKGVQKLEQIEKVVEFEEKRHRWLFEVASALRSRGISEESFRDVRPKDVSELFRKYSQVETVKRFFSGSAFALRAPGFKGLIGSEPVEDARLGLDLADICRLFGFRGIIHSDEIEKYKFPHELISELSEALGLGENDGFVLVFGEEERARLCLESIRERLIEALKGPVAETRYATEKGTTRYLRPRPGAARMYPETDIPTIVISKDMKEKYKVEIRTWDEAVSEFAAKYALERDLAEQILDSDYVDLFTLYMERYPGISARLLASLFVQVLIPYADKGKPLEADDINALVESYYSGRISKEGLIDVARYMAEKRVGLEQAIKDLRLGSISTEELRNIINMKLQELLREGMDPNKLYGALMGRVMSEVRGKIDGKVVNEEVKKALERLQKKA
ncbi:MAG: Glu-tRNA(Gln) amidotransferase subunit GatE [Nitrososphaeria archaeon]